MKWLGAFVLATTVIVVIPVRIEPAAAASSESTVHVSQATSSDTNPTNISARHHVRHFRHYSPYGYSHSRYGSYRPYYPRYYARPYSYEPDPYYAPLPFGLSFGIGRW